MKFRPGQEVICITDKWQRVPKTYLWGLIKIYSKFPHPKEGEIVTVHGYETNVHISLKEYDQKYAYNEEGFIPTSDISELSEVLKEDPFKVR